MRDILTSPLALVSITVTLGLAFGRIRAGQFSLGSSGALFVGLATGWLVVNTASGNEQTRLLAEGVIRPDLFYLALALFVGAVALSSSKYLDKVVKVYGLKLLAMGALVPFIGALSTWLFARIIPGVILDSIPGLFAGALTSSPGLASALEQVAGKGAEVESAVGFGYAVGYIPGVLIVVLGVQLIPMIFRLDTQRENRAFCEDLDIEPEEQARIEGGKFRPMEFFLIIALGYLIGSVKIPLGPLGSVGLGSTGGILFAGLALGFAGKIGPLDFRMPQAALAAVRELGIALFLAVVGLRYGYQAVESMATGGLPLLGLSLIVALLSISLGYAFGRYVLKLNWILLAGALCGSMTSTPGLGAAVEATGCDDVATGYGAVYPVALLSMVLFTIALSVF